MLMKLAVIVVLAGLAAATPVQRPQVEDRMAAIRPHIELPSALVEALAPEEKETGNANFYIDLVLVNLNRLMPERVDLPDFGTAVNMHDCYMFGLDNGLHRSGDATMLTIEDTVKFTAAFASRTVGMSCRWKYMLMGGDATGSTDVIDISAGISVSLASGSTPQLTEFRVTEVADIDTDITGLTFLFNWLAEDIANIIINDYKDQMVGVIETVVKDLMQQVLDDMHMPM